MFFPNFFFLWNVLTAGQTGLETLRAAIFARTAVSANASKKLVAYFFIQESSNPVPVC